MSSNTTEITDVHTSPPYVTAILILAVLTLVEIGIGTFDSDIVILSILAVLAAAKVIIIAAVFMHVAYEKDTRQIIFVCFVIPLIGVLLLTATIALDYRNY